jgi:hypothetical protein
MVASLIAEEERHKQSPHAKKGKSNKARRKHRNRGKLNPSELGTDSKGHGEAISGSAASISGRIDNAGERDTMGRDTARHNKPEGKVDAHSVEQSVAALFSTTTARATTSLKLPPTCWRRGWRSDRRSLNRQRIFKNSNKLASTHRRQQHRRRHLLWRRTRALALYVWKLRKVAPCCFHAGTRSCVRSAQRRFYHRAVSRSAPCVEQGL